MAEAVTTEAAPAESQPASVSMESLDAAMAQARETATAEAAVEDAAETTDAQERQQAATADRADATPIQPAASDDDAALEEDEQGKQPADQQPGKLSRAAKLREQISEADKRARDAESRLQERLGADLKVREKYAALVGTPEERQRLVNAIANQNTPNYELNQARARLAQMNQAQEELSPVYTAIQQDVFAHFTKGMEQLRTLDGMTDADHQALFKATSGVEALRLIHGIGQKAAEENFKGEISSLKATVSDLKRKLAAAGTQPASGGGLAPGGSTVLAGLLGTDGLPTEEAIRAAKNGKLRQLQSA